MDLSGNNACHMLCFFFEFVRMNYLTLLHCPDCGDGLLCLHSAWILTLLKNYLCPSPCLVHFPVSYCAYQWVSLFISSYGPVPFSWDISYIFFSLWEIITNYLYSATFVVSISKATVHLVSSHTSPTSSSSFIRITIVLWAHPNNYATCNC